MKTLLKCSLLFTITTLLHFSCIREVKNIKLPQPEDAKIVVGCFISPQDSVLQATITTSHSPYGFTDDGYPVAENAAVTISDGAHEEIFTYSRPDSLYLLPASKMKIQPGFTYFLKVEIPGLKTVTASTRVPDRVNTSLTYHLDSTVKTDASKKTVNYKLSVDFEDLPGELNYYRLYGQAKINYRLLTESDTSTIDFGYPLVVDDEGFLSNTSKTIESYEAATGYIRLAEVNMLLLNIDPAYYQYYRWLRDPGRGPFSEPKVVYTNIEGGLGVFASFQKFIVPVNLHP